MLRQAWRETSQLTDENSDKSLPNLIYKYEYHSVLAATFVKYPLETGCRLKGFEAVLKILEKHDPLKNTQAKYGAVSADEASTVQNYVEHMLFLLIEEQAKDASMGPILEFVVSENIMEKLFLWSLRREFTDETKIEQLKMYEMLVTQSHQPLLHHKPILKPLMMLLSSCSGTATPTVETELVVLLNQLCSIIAKDPSILELFFHTSEDQGAANFLIFSLLIPFIHREGTVGQQARDALLFIMSLSAENNVVANHIAENTYFCPVAHPLIRNQLVNYIYNGFLVPVMAPALHKVTVEEVMATTAYLDLFLRSVSEPSLLKIFLRFILLHRHENVHILDTLTSRINTPFRARGLGLTSTLLSAPDSGRGPCESTCIVECGRTVDISYLQYLGEAQEAILQCLKDCKVWSALYDGVNPDPDTFIQTLAEENDTDVEHLMFRLQQRTPSMCSSSHTTPFGEKMQLELEWDDSYDTGISPGSDVSSPHPYDDLGSTEMQPPIEPPKHIQEMKKNAIMLIKGSYIEESDFQDDVMVYRLCAQKDTQEDNSKEKTSNVAKEHQVGSQTVVNGPLANSQLETDLDEHSKTNSSLTQGVMKEHTNQKVAETDPQPDLELKLSPQEADHNLSVRLLSTDGEDFIAQYDKIIKELDPNNASLEEEKLDAPDPVSPAEEEEDFENFSADTPSAESVSSPFGPKEDPSPKRATRSQSAPFTDLKFDLQERDCELPQLPPLQPLLREESSRCTVVLRSSVEVSPRTGEQQAVAYVGTGGTYPEVPVACALCWGLGWLFSICRPFISVVLSKLENMLENSLHVNLLLIGIITQLASYPQPLLRSFLLNTNMVFQPSVRSLYQVLASVKNKIEHFASIEKDFPGLLLEAQQYLLFRVDMSDAAEELQTKAPGTGYLSYRGQRVSLMAMQAAACPSMGMGKS
ncbi:UPF0518 protein FAM160A1 [Aix galericulata]|nr:UPF0518 protein FAM160A1 [Aix galericulata]